MTDELWDSDAWVCVDCLFLIANGDMPDFAYQYPEKSEEEAIEMEADYRARIERAMSGFNITLGHGREKHECATNVTVTPIYRQTQDNGAHVTTQSEEDTKEYRADTVSEAIEQAEFDFTGDNVIGFRGVMHDLETKGDQGGECYCEEISFATKECDHCGAYHGGTWNAATIWKITEES